MKHRTDRGRKTAIIEKTGSNRCGTTLITASQCVQSPKTRNHGHRHESSPSRKAVCRFFAIKVQNMPVRGRCRKQIRRRKCCLSPFECDFRDVSPGRNYSTLFSITITDAATTPNRNILHIGPYFLTRCRAHAMQEAQSHCDSNRNARNHGQKQRTYTKSASNSNRVTQQPTERSAKSRAKRQSTPIAKNCCICIAL